MKIQSQDPSSAAISSITSTVAKNGPNATVLANTSASKSTQSAGVAVSVSATTRSLEASLGSDVADVDMEKVAALQEQIAGGTYVVNPKAIADAMLTDASARYQR